jgi:hypothetical protein
VLLEIRQLRTPGFAPSRRRTICRGSSTRSRSRAKPGRRLAGRSRSREVGRRKCRHWARGESTSALKLHSVFTSYYLRNKTIYRKRLTMHAPTQADCPVKNTAAWRTVDPAGQSSPSAVSPRGWTRLHHSAPCPYRYAKALRAWKHCEEGMEDCGWHGDQQSAWLAEVSLPESRRSD